METLLLESDILLRVHEDVRKRFTGVDDLAHGWEHVNRVYNLALSIARQEGADSFVVGMAALMHELDDHRYMLDHFYSKLLKLAETMTTKTGRILAQRRSAFMRTYLYEFKRELGA